MKRAEPWWQTILGPEVDPQASLELSYYVYERGGKGINRCVLDGLVQRLWRRQ